MRDLTLNETHQINGASCAITLGLITAGIAVMAVSPPAYAAYAAGQIALPAFISSEIGAAAAGAYVGGWLIGGTVDAILNDANKRKKK